MTPPLIPVLKEGGNRDYTKQPDQDQWVKDYGRWRVEIQQDENGDWTWNLFDRNWQGPILEIKGKADTFNHADNSALK